LNALAPLALVTGATGFVGSHTVEALLTQNYRVRCLVREQSDLSALPRERVELCRGTLTDAAALDAAVLGTDLVIHGAGRMRADDEQAYEEVNVLGTRNLVEAVKRRAPRLRRFVLVSSLAAGGPSSLVHPRSEDDPDQPQNAYGRSKRRGEDEVERLGTAVAWTILRPVAVYGPRDRSFLVLARLAARGFLFRLGGARQPVQLIHVRDLARAILRAGEEERAVGRRYYLAHPQPTEWTEVGALMARVVGKRVRTLSLPRGVIPVVGRCAAIGSRVLRQPNVLPADRLRDLLAPAWTCATRRAAEELGFRAEINLPAGVAETMAWYRSAGWV
jgi:nucleoside-diphosphate-sugar epimerase